MYKKRRKKKKEEKERMKRILNYTLPLRLNKIVYNQENLTSSDQRMILCTQCTVQLVSRSHTYKWSGAAASRIPEWAWTGSRARLSRRKGVTSPYFKLGPTSFWMPKRFDMALFQLLLLMPESCLWLVTLSLSAVFQNFLTVIKILFFLRRPALTAAPCSSRPTGWLWLLLLTR
jgi:hypothetical protein